MRFLSLFFIVCCSCVLELTASSSELNLAENAKSDEAKVEVLSAKYKTDYEYTKPIDGIYDKPSSLNKIDGQNSLDRIYDKPSSLNKINGQKSLDRIYDKSSSIEKLPGIKDKPKKLKKKDSLKGLDRLPDDKYSLYGLESKRKLKGLKKMNDYDKYEKPSKKGKKKDSKIKYLAYRLESVPEQEDDPDIKPSIHYKPVKKSSLNSSNSSIKKLSLRKKKNRNLKKIKN